MTATGLTVLQLQSDTGLSGGIASYIAGSLLAGSTHEMLVVVPGAASEPAQARTLYGAAQLITLPENSGKRGLLPCVRKLIGIVRDHHVNVLHAHALRSGFVAALASWWTGVPLVYTNHGLRYRQKKSMAARSIFWLIELMVCRRAAVICAVRASDYGRLRHSWLVSKSRLRLIETQVRLPPAALTCKSHSKGVRTRPRLIGLGTLIDVKRPDRFLDWLEALALRGLEFEAAWLGGGPLLGALRDRVRASGLPIVFTGHVSRETVFRHLGISDLLLLTSQFEVFPLSVIEAYASGAPVIAARFEGVEDFVIAGQTGLVVDPNDAPAAASAIAELIGQPKRLAAMSTQARLLFKERFANPPRMADDYSAAYRLAAVNPWEA